MPRLIYTLEITFAGIPTPVYLSRGRYVSRAGDTPASTNFMPRLIDAAINESITVAAWQRRSPAPAFSDITIVNTDGGLNSWRNLDIRKQKLVLKRGYQNADYATFEVIATAHGESLIVEDIVRISTINILSRLEAPMTETWPVASGVFPEWESKRKRFALGSIAYAGADHISSSGGDKFFAVSDTAPETWTGTDLYYDAFSSLPFGPGTNEWFDDLPAAQGRSTTTIEGDWLARNFIGSVMGDGSLRSTTTIDVLILEILRRAGIAESEVDTVSLATIATLDALLATDGECGIAGRDESCEECLETVLNSFDGFMYNGPDGIAFSYLFQILGVPTGLVTGCDLVRPISTAFDDAPGLTSSYFGDVNWQPLSSGIKPLPATADVGVRTPQQYVHDRYGKAANAAPARRTIWRGIEHTNNWLIISALAYQYERKFTTLEIPATIPVIAGRKLTIGAEIVDTVTDLDWLVVSKRYRISQTTQTIEVFNQWEGFI